MAFVIRELLDAGLVHDDVLTVAGEGGLRALPPASRRSEGGNLVWQPGRAEPRRHAIVLRPVAEPFAPEGGLKLLRRQSRPRRDQDLGGQAEHRLIEAPAAIFTEQDELLAAFKAGELERDLVAVVPLPGPARPTACPSCTS